MNPGTFGTDPRKRQRAERQLAQIIAYRHRAPLLALFVDILGANVENEKVTDAEFRDLVRDTLADVAVSAGEEGQL